MQDVALPLYVATVTPLKNMKIKISLYYVFYSDIMREIKGAIEDNLNIFYSSFNRRQILIESRGNCSTTNCFCQYFYQKNI